jgi:hypothetical protein
MRIKEKPVTWKAAVKHQMKAHLSAVTLKPHLLFVIVSPYLHLS